VPFYLPLSQGRAGFILSPIIEDAVGYASFANSRESREVRSLTLKIEPSDRLLFADTAQIELEALPPTHRAEKFFNQLNSQLFSMFKSLPVQHYAHTPVSTAAIDGAPVAVLHAPSEMTFNLPKGAQQATGSFGFLPGTYANGGNTNGAEFIIVWSNGSQNIELFRRFLNPVQQVEDRGLQQFKIPLSHLAGGRLYLRIDSGPLGNFSWDWTGWSNIEIK